MNNKIQLDLSWAEKLEDLSDKEFVITIPGAMLEHCSKKKFIKNLRKKLLQEQKNIFKSMVELEKARQNLELAGKETDIILGELKNEFRK